MYNQRTIRQPIQAKGIGVHSGTMVTMTLRPAPANTGVIFNRIDLTPSVQIPARAEFVGDTSLSTCLINDGVRVSTVEHLLSAFSGLGVDNAYVDLTTDELPIMDGSCAPFIFLIQSAGIVELEAPKKFMLIKELVRVEQAGKWAQVMPFNGFKVDFSIEFDHPLFTQENQVESIDFSKRCFTKEIARARTFGFSSDWEYMCQNNLAKGASLTNAVVFDNFKVVNDDGLRYNNEPVKHKILDVVGDLFLLGHNLIGAFSGYKSGHALNNLLLNELLSRENAWEIVTFEQVSSSLPILFPPVEEAFA